MRIQPHRDREREATVAVDVTLHSYITDQRNNFTPTYSHSIVRISHRRVFCVYVVREFFFFLLLRIFWREGEGVYANTFYANHLNVGVTMIVDCTPNAGWDVFANDIQESLYLK